MRTLWSEYIYPGGYAILLILLNFTAALAPLMFTVGTIAAVDRCGAHYSMLDKLTQHSNTALASITYASDDYGYVAVTYTNSTGATRYANLYLQYYGPEVKAELQPGAQARIRYIDSQEDDTGRVILDGYEAAVRGYVCITSDIWGILLAGWLLVMVKPQVAFLGFVAGDKLMEDAIGHNALKPGGVFNRRGNK